jgi:hypothetical protein
MTARIGRFVHLLAISLCGTAVALASGLLVEPPAHLRWRQHDMHRPKPPVADPASTPGAAPKDAIVLFDGFGLSAWETPEGRPARWLVKDGILEVAPGTGSIQTRSSFGDLQLHVEWAAPTPPVRVGQDRGNSGIFLMGQFEIQVIDSYKSDTYADGMAGAIYGQYPPLFNAARPPGQWQTFDIAFRRPRYDGSGKLSEPARVTVFLNGILVQNSEEPWGQTAWLEPIPYDPTVDRGPILLQDHGQPVQFRNIWVRNLPDRPVPSIDDLKPAEIVRLTTAELDACVGTYEAGPEPDALRVSVTRQEGHLLLKVPVQPIPLRLEPVSDLVYVMPHTDAQFTFEKDPQGRVASGIFRAGDSERTLKKSGHR